MAALNFKASDIEIEERPRPTYGPLPAGEYEMMVVKSVNKRTKKDDGSYLELEMHVVSGEHAGRRHWERLNLDNPKEEAVTIAKKKLNGLCAALGLKYVNDSEELHDRVFVATVQIDRRDETRNDIPSWGYRSVDGAPVSPAKLATPAPDRQAPPAAPVKPAASRPWG